VRGITRPDERQVRQHAFQGCSRGVLATALTAALAPGLTSGHFFSGVPNLDFPGTPVTPKQHFVSAAERLWNASGTHIRSTFDAHTPQP
jgi:hypothetical protein